MNLSHIYFLSEVGGKANQEDFIWPEAGTATLQDKVFIVCDGIGGSENGEIASRIIAETTGNALLHLRGRDLTVVALNSILENARNELIKFAYQNGMNTNMGTTITILVLFDNKAFISWCGDSRIYHFRNNEILYKTADHSLVNSLLKTGEITEEEALVHPKKNVIFRAIKADDTPLQVDHHIIKNVREGDYFMLCTDGILENITDKDLKFLLKQNEDGNTDIIESFQQFCEGKTKDNYSMYLLKIKSNHKSGGYKKRIITLIILLVVLIAASLFFLSSYFYKTKESKSYPKEKISPASITAPATDTSNKNEKASETRAEYLNPDTPVTKPPAKHPAADELKDSLKLKKEKNTKDKKKPNIIMIDNSADSTQ